MLRALLSGCALSLALFTGGAALAQPAGRPAVPASPTPTTVEGATVATPASGKIAVVDTRRALMETEEGLRVRATLTKLFEAREIEFKNREKQLEQEREDLAKEEKAKPGASLEAKKDALKLKIAQFQQGLMEYQREAQRKESEATQPMLQKVLGFVSRVAAQEGYDIVVDKAALPYFRRDLDITDRVIQLYNAGDPGAKTKPSKDATKAPAKDPKPAPKPEPKK
jgi:outer membrane protein